MTSLDDPEGQPPAKWIMVLGLVLSAVAVVAMIILVRLIRVEYSNETKLRNALMGQPCPLRSPRFPDTWPAEVYQTAVMCQDEKEHLLVVERVRQDWSVEVLKFNTESLADAGELKTWLDRYMKAGTPGPSAEP